MNSWGRFTGGSVPGGGSYVISGFGLLLILLWIWYAIRFNYTKLDSSTLSAEQVLGLKVIEVVIILGISVVLIYAGFWFYRSDFSAEQRWLAAVWTILGGVGIITVIVVMNAHQMAEGDIIEHQLLAEEILLGWAGGSLTGLLVGLGNAESDRQADRVERQRDTFVFLNDLLRHNILNGITIIQGQASLLAERNAAEDSSELDKIDNRCASMADLIQDVRCIARFLSGAAETAPVDLSEIVRSEVCSAENTYDNAEFEVRVPDSLVVSGSEALSIVFENLLRNAVQHNDSAAPRVVVSANQVGDTIHLSVADNGPGIPAGERETLFEPSDQGDHGFGLYLVSTIIETTGGEIRVQNNDPSGSVFVLSLPFHSAKGSTPNQSVDEPAVGRATRS